MEVLCRTWIAMGLGDREARAQVTLGVSLDKTGQKLVLSKSDFTLDNIEMTVEQSAFSGIYELALSVAKEKFKEDIVTAANDALHHVLDNFVQNAPPTLMAAVSGE